jgi:hypothetical protein
MKMIFQDLHSLDDAERIACWCAQLGLSVSVEKAERGWQVASLGERALPDVPRPPPGPPGREMRTGFFGFHETKESVRRSHDYQVFMHGYDYALGMGDWVPDTSVRPSSRPPPAGGYQPRPQKPNNPPGHE